MGKFSLISQIPILTILLIALEIKIASSHGRFLNPPSRSSVWRFKEFSVFNPPANYNDNELFCGGIHQVDNPGRDCGVCGDPVGQPQPRRNEIGGMYYKGIITGKYRVGQLIEVEADITASHKGFMEWRLCTNIQTETQTCFDRYLLQRADGQGSKVPVVNTGLYKATLKLPSGISCDHCIIQWNYRAGNNWGKCGNGTSGVGCGPQETFRGCADILIQ